MSDSEARDDEVKGLEPVIVTTEHRGVFFGWAQPKELSIKEKIFLVRLRNVIYWSSETGGFLGLAANGP